ncbi:hypothetical protein ASE40_19225 [Flavobacterium sp. Root935]|uniref:hypothetical protein n=1 Tax=Flavobacterium sp. Root935 TaxID=1736610 RepID=UPI00070B6561|nr:hypothetical protein [Flavobacterium sp. Root935]KRD58460.1 hypothetical protein ASE40_19225 [Flavobacterium sp. Root935]
MKKILTLFAVVGLIAFSSCEGPEGPPGQDGLTGEAFEILNTNFSFNATDGYFISGTFQSKVGGDLFDDETVLIYRLKGTIDAQTPIWQLIPTTLYFNNGDEITYDYDFSRKDFQIYAGANYDLAETPSYVNNQSFRIVIIPSALAKTVNKNNFNDVMSVLKLKESDVQKIKL